MTRTILPPGWKRPRGYANGMAKRGELLAVAGQIGWNAREEFESDEFLPQFRQALRNVAAVVDAAGGTPADIISLTLYVTDKQEYLADLPAVGAAYREVLEHFPSMALVEVVDLLEDRAALRSRRSRSSTPPESGPT